jgi:hypothetical protein
MNASRALRTIVPIMTTSAVVIASRWASAEVAPPVDVTVHEAPLPMRRLSIEWNPLSLLAIGKLSANLVAVPVDHHAVVLSPFYVSVSTAPISVYDDAGNETRLPKQTFSGFGGEFGYRYYLDRGGPRGFFAGPSLLLSSLTAQTANGTRTPYLDYGFAMDAGYQALVAERIALCLGAGVQYTDTSKSIPNQQFPANVYANRGLRPRLLLSFGWAF